MMPSHRVDGALSIMPANDADHQGHNVTACSAADRLGAKGECLQRGRPAARTSVEVDTGLLRQLLEEPVGVRKLGPHGRKEDGTAIAGTDHQPVLVGLQRRKQFRA